MDEAGMREVLCREIPNYALGAFVLLFFLLFKLALVCLIIFLSF